MIPHDHAIMLYKFGESRWINQIINGNLSFSCAGAFINQAEKTGNNIQGDKYEGVFARLKKEDQRIDEMKDLLGDDLELLQDGEYTFLRRKSVKLRPIFCLFAYLAKDVVNDPSVKQTGVQTVRLDFDHRLREGFVNTDTQNVLSESHRFTLAYLLPKPFIDRMNIALFNNKISYDMNMVRYIDFNNEFFITPTPHYNELLVKSNKYEYQHEARICLYKDALNCIFDRYNLRILKFNDDEYHLFYEEIYFKIDVRIDEKTEERKWPN